MSLSMLKQRQRLHQRKPVRPSTTRLAGRSVDVWQSPSMDAAHRALSHPICVAHVFYINHQIDRTLKPLPCGCRRTSATASATATSGPRPR
jgi:hypothetical protein